MGKTHQLHEDTCKPVVVNRCLHAHDVKHVAKELDVRCSTNFLVPLFGRFDSETARCVVRRVQILKCSKQTRVENVKVIKPHYHVDAAQNTHELSVLSCIAIVK